MRVLVKPVSFVGLRG